MSVARVAVSAMTARLPTRASPRPRQPYPKGKRLHPPVGKQKEDLWVEDGTRAFS